MKAVILAGGLGTRILKETHLKPKPMIEIGGQPILWHIMKIYASHGITDFIVCCGYKGYVIKEFFANYFLHTSDVTFDLARNEMEVHARHAEPWRVTLVDTGEHSGTGGQLKRVARYLDPVRTLLFHLRRWRRRRGHHGQHRPAPGLGPPGDADGHLSAGPLRPAGRRCRRPRAHLQGKARGDGGVVNGGFFVLQP